MKGPWSQREGITLRKLFKSVYRMYVRMYILAVVCGWVGGCARVCVCVHTAHTHVYITKAQTCVHAHVQ